MCFGGPRQVTRRDGEHRIGRAGRGPDHVEGEQVLVHQRCQRARIAEGRGPADREPGRAPGLLGIGRAHARSSHVRGEARDICPVAARGKRDEHLAAGDEHERFHDLTDVASDGARRVGRGLRALGKPSNLHVDAPAACFGQKTIEGTRPPGLHACQDTIDPVRMAERSPPLVPTPSVGEWRDLGRLVDAAGRKIFMIEMGDPGAPHVLILHGFPGSSYDWHEVMRELAAGGLRVVAFDFLGHGFSDKPGDTPYSLFEQADIAEAVARMGGIDRCVLVSHDMGDTVAAELLMRSTEEALGFEVERSIVTNGSIFMHLVQLSPGQLALLALPDEALAESLPLEGFRPALAATFRADKQPPGAQLDAMLELIRVNDGDRVLPRVVRYIEERRRNQERWTAGLVRYPGPMTAIWGAQDPIAVVEMAYHLKEIRPATEVVVWEDVAHWPSIEEPVRLARAIASRMTS